MLDGSQFRFSGANIEWLGLVGYGPLNFSAGQNETYPTHYEIDDALATAKAMGSTVIRAQTLGDTVGCGNCLEPTLGHFNAQAFDVMDYAVARARADGIRLIFEFLGDARAEDVSSTADIFSNWRGGADFWTDPTVIHDFENHVAAILNHVNVYTGVPNKDDPTILGWMDCNACTSGTTAADLATTANWVSTISGFVKGIDPHHLFLDNSGLTTPQMLAIPTVDVYSTEIYPHWSQYYGLPPSQVADVAHEEAAQAAAAGKVWAMSEFGWDKTDFATEADLTSFLDGITADPDISGDLFWALESHASGHGWQPLPANEECQAGASDSAPPTQPDPTGAGCSTNEDGNWWALYYTGISTLSNTAADMQARAQILRTHAYQMRGIPVPPQSIPPAPIITRTSGGRIYWEGSAGAVDYSIQRSSTGWGNWKTVCDRCVTDQSNGWATTSSGYYRVIPYNLDGRPGPASRPAGTWQSSW
jgi:mannan endo-1,4-beta-mannosidase